MSKKIPALLLALLLALPTFCMAAGTQIEVRPPDGPVREGEEFSVAVELTGNTGFRGIQFTLNYDHDEMECLEAEKGTLLAGTFGGTNPDSLSGAVVLASSLDVISQDGTLLDLVFQAKKDLDSFHFGIADAQIVRDDYSLIEYTVVGAEKLPRDPVQPDTEPTEPDIPDLSGGSGESSQPSQPDTPEVPDKLPSQPDVPDPPEDSGGAQEAAEPRFTDTAGNWAEAYINQAADRGLFGGYSDGSFRPGNRLTRSEFMIVLWNLAGRPEPLEAGSPFADVADRSETVRKAVAWGYQQGYINGTGPEAFTPGGALTRQAAMKILFGYYGGGSGIELILTSVYDETFTDSGLISAWAKPAMYWGVYHEILNGTSPTTLSPGGTMTRAQLAAIMVRYTNRFPNAE